MEMPGQGEAWDCAACGRLVTGPGSWGITPSALCLCAQPQPRKPAATAPQIKIPHLLITECYGVVIGHLRAQREHLTQLIDYLEALEVHRQRNTMGVINSFTTGGEPTPPPIPKIEKPQ